MTSRSCVLTRRAGHLVQEMLAHIGDMVVMTASVGPQHRGGCLTPSSCVTTILLDDR